MLWVIVVITVCTFSIFSVTSTMQTCFSQKTNSFGKFTSHTGDEVEITQQMYYHALDLLRRFIQGREALTDDMIITHIILVHEAEEAGIYVTNEEIREAIGLKGLTKEEYFARLQRMGFDSATKYEEGVREMLMKLKCQQFLTLNDNLITSEDLYNEYKIENEEFKLAYVAFPYEKYRDTVEAEPVSDEELTAYYEGLSDSSPEVVEHFSEAEKFAFDVAYLDLAKVDFAEYEELTKDLEVNESDITRLYEETKERFKIVTVEDKPVEESDDVEEAKEEEPPVKYRDLNDEEVRTQIERECKLIKLVEKANVEWTDYARKEEIIDKKDTEEKPEDPALEGAEEPTPESGEETAEAAEAAEAKETPDEHFQSIVDHYRLSLVRFEDLVSLDDLETLEPFGSEMLMRRVRYLKINNAVFIRPDKDHPDLTFLLRITDRVERRKKALDEVRDLAVERFKRQKCLEMAERDARAFEDALKEKARGVEEVVSFIKQFEEDALAGAERAIQAKGEITDEEAAKIREDALTKIQPDIDSLLKRHLYHAFDEEVAARGLTAETIDYFSLASIRNPEFYKQDDSPEKFLKSNRSIQNLDTDGVTEPLNDQKDEAWFVVRVLDRRFPPPESMTEEDYKEVQLNMEQRRMMELRYPQLRKEPRENPFAFDKIVKEYEVKYYQEKDKEAEGKSPAGDSMKKAPKKEELPVED